MPRRRRSTERSIRSLMFTANLSAEGAPFSQYELTAGLKRRGAIETEVVSPTDGPLRSCYESQGVPVRIEPGRIRAPDSVADHEAEIGRLSGLIEHFRPDVVYANTLEGHHAIEAAFRAGVPSIWNIRESEPWKTCFFHLGATLADRALDAFQYPRRIVFVSEASRRIYEPLNTRDNFSVIPNGISPHRFQSAPSTASRARVREALGINAETLLILSVATVTPRKGQMDLLSAFRALPAEIAARSQLRLVGDRAGEYSRQCHAQVAAMPAAWRSRIQLVAETPLVEDWYHAADLFALCSRRESCPRVLLEAMHFGLPILTTPVDGIPEQVTENENALFYSPGDVEALGGALRRLLLDESLRSRMARASREQLARLPTCEAMLDAYHGVFQDAATHE